MPIRTCCGCGAKKEKHELVRYLWQNSAITCDVQQKLPGRGAYCCQEQKCLDLFLKQGKRWKRLFRLSK